jgi:hypothetical protein
MKELRNTHEKEGDPERETDWEFIPITRLTSAQIGGGKVYWSAPPGTPPPAMGFQRHYVEVGGRRFELLELFRRYFDLLRTLLNQFEREYLAGKAGQS